MIELHGALDERRALRSVVDMFDALLSDWDAVDAGRLRGPIFWHRSRTQAEKDRAAFLARLLAAEARCEALLRCAACGQARS
jgi:hypothetical protein